MAIGLSGAFGWSSRDTRRERLRERAHSLKRGWTTTTEADHSLSWYAGQLRCINSQASLSCVASSTISHASVRTTQQVDRYYHLTTDCCKFPVISQPLQHPSCTIQRGSRRPSARTLPTSLRVKSVASDIAMQACERQSQTLQVDIALPPSRECFRSNSGSLERTQRRFESRWYSVRRMPRS